MQETSPQKVEAMIRLLPVMVQEMMGYDFTPEQIQKMVQGRCSKAADTIHQMNHKPCQKKGAKSGWGGGVSNRGAGR